MYKTTIVVTGNPVDGFVFYGPWDNSDAAVDGAEDMRLAGDWWIAPLADPYIHGEQ